MNSPRRRKGKPHNPSATVHDRRAIDLLRNAVVSPIEVDDPYEAGEKIIVMRSIKDPLANLHARGFIDDAQYSAGRRYQKYWESAEQGARAIDIAKEKVDGGIFVEPDTERRRDAAIELNLANGKLGKIGSAVVYDVLIGGLSIEGIVEKHGLKGQYQVRVFSKKFQDCLDILAVIWGFSNACGSS